MQSCWNTAIKEKAEVGPTSHLRPVLMSREASPGLLVLFIKSRPAAQAATSVHAGSILRAAAEGRRGRPDISTIDGGCGDTDTAAA
jgi:hypothetical protein